MSHITGKVYELTQENINKLINELEVAQTKNEFLIKEVKMLEQSARLLGVLEEYGVDNWDGYIEAMKAYRKESGDGK